MRPSPTPRPSRSPRRPPTVAGVLALTLVAPAAVLLAPAGPAGAAPATPSRDPIGAATATITGNTTGDTTGGSSVAWSGWALDLDAPASPTSVVALVDGVARAAAATTLPQPAITAKYHANRTPGFIVSVAIPADGLRHTTCLAARNLGGGLPSVLRCKDVGDGPAAVASHDPFGTATGSYTGSTVTFTGRATDPDYRNRQLAVTLWIDGRRAATGLTRSRGAVAPGVGSNSWYRLSARAAAGRAHTACLRVTDIAWGSNRTLGCRRFDLKSHRADPLTAQDAARLRGVVALARQQFGKPYVWAAAGPKAFDCSGLVMWTYRKNRLTTPRIAQDQFAAARLIPASRVRPGDLVFYYDATGYVHHVGIYVSPGMTIAAMSPELGIGWQPVSQTPGWDGSGVSYGSFTHT